MSRLRQATHGAPRSRPVIAGLVIGLMAGLNLSSSGQELDGLPPAEFNFDEEAEPATEYLVDELPEYLKWPKRRDADQTAMDRGQPSDLGGGLWPGQESLIPQFVAPTRPKLIQPNGFRRPEDPRLALTDAQRVSPEVIPEAYLPFYFAEAPKHFLTDPQRLLSDPEWQDTDWYLTCHSNECHYNISLLLFGSDERIPTSVSGPQLLDRWFPEQDHVLVFYFNGRPDRVEVFFPAILADSFPETDFQRNLKEAIAAASELRAGATQLDEFCQKLGTRLLWWEKRLKVSRPGVAPSEPRPDLRLAGSADAEVVSTHGDSDRGFGSIVWGLIGTFTLSLVGLIVWAIVTGLKGGNRAVRFPEQQSPPRLGAPHSGGGGVVLTFGSRPSP